ncbi:AhpC/TSA family protein [Prochlorococcus sp. MIT 1300]|uniref:AhpC/TSA family protein n=1 Tax=Prochlorococcus sp. MIT 1300 TaxID=3096218 RepID=UPI002A75E3C8|nr:AhpC/TSA family protein [Prochlorococcus sp. MIT 1300]
MFSTDAIRFLLNKVDSTSYHKNKNNLLVIVFGVLGDFDSIEYATKLVSVLPRFKSLGVDLIGIGIGSTKSRELFCSFTGFPKHQLLIERDNTLHCQLELYEGVNTPFGSWGNMLIMCGGFGSPGTLKEVLRGYTGDRDADQSIASDEKIKIGFLPELSGKFFDMAGGNGFQRPFELATLRLRNMLEVLHHWNEYVPNINFLTQRGGTFLFDRDDQLLYSYKAQGILCYSETMSEPLSFLDRSLGIL